MHNFHDKLLQTLNLRKPGKKYILNNHFEQEIYLSGVRVLLFWFRSISFLSISSLQEAVTVVIVG